MTYFLTQKFRYTESAMCLATTNPFRVRITSLPLPSYLISVQVGAHTHTTLSSRRPPHHVDTSDPKYDTAHLQVKYKKITVCLFNAILLPRPNIVPNILQNFLRYSYKDILLLDIFSVCYFKNLHLITLVSKSSSLASNFFKLKNRQFLVPPCLNFQNKSSRFSTWTERIRKQHKTQNHKLIRKYLGLGRCAWNNKILCTELKNDILSSTRQKIF
jgi:hypothetical protein